MFQVISYYFSSRDFGWESRDLCPRAPGSNRARFPTIPYYCLTTLDFMHLKLMKYRMQLNEILNCKL